MMRVRAQRESQTRKQTSPVLSSIQKAKKNSSPLRRSFVWDFFEYGRYGLRQSKKLLLLWLLFLGFGILFDYEYIVPYDLAHDDANDPIPGRCYLPRYPVIHARIISCCIAVVIE